MIVSNLGTLSDSTVHGRGTISDSPVMGESDPVARAKPTAYFPFIELAAGPIVQVTVSKVRTLIKAGLIVRCCILGSNYRLAPPPLPSI